MSLKIPDEQYTRKVLGWMLEAIQEGEGFLKAQRGYTKISDCIDAVMGDKVDLRSSTLSSTTDNRFGKIAEDSAAYLTDIKPFWEYKTWNKKFEKQQENFGKLSNYWWHSGGVAKAGADLGFSDTIKYSLVGGTGWPVQEYDPIWGDLTLSGEDPRDVIPIRPNSFLTIQDAYGVIIRKERTVNWVRSQPCAKGKEHLITPTRDGTIQASLSETRAGKLMEWLGSPFRNRLFNSQAARQIPKIPVLGFFKAYIADESINESGSDRFMGEWKNGEAINNWSYKVKPGEKLYPNKRLIIFTESVVLYDGPSPYWHGLFPCPKLTLIPYPWTFLGKGALWDLVPLQRTLDRMLRGCDDHFEKVFRPDIKADKNSMSKAMLDRIDTRKAGGKFMTNPLAGKGFEIINPPPLPPEVKLFIDFYITEMSTLSGVSDLQQLAKLNQMPGEDTVDKIMGTMTAAIRLRSRVIENFMKEFAQQLAYNFLQFYTLPQRLAILGEDGITSEDFDYDPDSMLPDYIHDEDLDPLTGVPTKEAVARGPRPKYERAKAFMQQFTYNISPSSLLAGSALESKLLYLQLSRAGLIDHWTLLEKLEIPNVGLPPTGATTITDRLKAEQEMNLEMQVSASGRKSSGQKGPRLAVKES